MRLNRSTFSAALTASGVAFAPAPAFAHGTAPESRDLVFVPGSPNELIVLATFGILYADIAANTYRWVCPEALELAYTADWTVDPTFVRMNDGALVVASLFGLRRGAPSGCDFASPDAALSSAFLADGVLDPTDSETVYVVTSEGGQSNSLYRSTDEGMTFAPYREPVDEVLFESMRIAPSDPTRVYLSGVVPGRSGEPTKGYVHRSDDGGATWTRTEIPLGTEERTVLLLAVSPTSPDVLFAVVVGVPGVPERVLRSADGGATFRMVLKVDDVRDAAYSLDGAHFYVGGREDTGLHVSTDDGLTFERAPGLASVGCVEPREDGLYYCADTFGDGFLVGRTLDHGETSEPVLDVMGFQGLPTCDADDPTTTICSPWVADLVAELALPFDAGVPLDGGPVTGGDGGANLADSAVTALDGGAGSVDADGSMAQPPGDEGCACRVASSASGGSSGRAAGWWAAGVAALVSRRRRRRRQGASRDASKWT